MKRFIQDNLHIIVASIAAPMLINVIGLWWTMGVCFVWGIVYTGLLQTEADRQERIKAEVELQCELAKAKAKREYEEGMEIL